MKSYGIITEQKWVERYKWNNVFFNKYLIKFDGNDNFYTITRNEKIEQALIRAHLIYSLKNDNEVDKHKIVGYDVDNEEKYYVLSHTKLKEIISDSIKELHTKNYQ